MADDETPVEEPPAAEKSTDTKPPSGKETKANVVLAAHSGDAGVQNLLAAREVAQLNEDDDAVKEIDTQLSELFKGPGE